MRLMVHVSLVVLVLFIKIPAGKLLAEEPKFPAPSEEKVDPAKAPRATGVKAILVAQTDDEGIGAGCAANLLAMELYSRGLPSFDPEKDLVVLKGKKVTTGNLFDAIEKLSVRKTDALVFYFAGHGKYNPELAAFDDPSRGHLLQMVDDGPLRNVRFEGLYRSAIKDALRKKNAQLTVLVTDTCNISKDDISSLGGLNSKEAFGLTFVGEKGQERDLKWVHAKATLPTKGDLGFGEKEPKPCIKSKTLEKLLFEHHGTVDISGSSHGQFGWYNPDGGWFTIGLLGSFEDNKNDPIVEISSRFDRIHWTNHLDFVSLKTSAVFKYRKEIISSLPEPKREAQKTVRANLQTQKDQRVQIFEMKVKYGEK